MARYAGVDYGTRRIGLALSDYAGTIASPADVLESARDLPRDAARVTARDAARVADWARANEATTIVVGLPLNMDGTDSEQTRLTRRFAAALAAAAASLSSDRATLPASAPLTTPPAPAPLTIELWDERLSSFAADELISDGLIAGAKIRRSKKKSARDAMAACVTLQAYLDARRTPRGDVPRPPPAGP
ncbi:putative Holliday junction resolvase [Phycisphaerae bacterium RAS1]|nr:putative Holliday junction resolvase [Phycisphaerae bacterium RAS1]